MKLRIPVGIEGDGSDHIFFMLSKFSPDSSKTANVGLIS